MNIIGTLKSKGDIIHVSETFKKRPFIIEVVEGDAGQYINVLQFELTQDKCDRVDKYEIGQQLEVEFNIRGREWTSPQGEEKVFTSLQAWMVKSVEGEGQAPPEMTTMEVPEEEIPF